MPGAVAPSAESAKAFAVRTMWVPPRASMLLSGELDVAGLPTLEGAILTVLSIRPLPLVVDLDLKELQFVDVLGARALLDAVARISDVTRAELAGGSSRVMGVLNFVERVADPTRGFQPSGHAVSSPRRRRRTRRSGIQVGEVTVEDQLWRPALMARAVVAELATTILLAGELDLTGIDTLNRCVDGVLAADPSPQRVHVDAIALHFIDPAGAQALITALDRLTDRFLVEISWLQPQVQRVLSLAQAPVRMEAGRTKR